VPNDNSLRVLVADGDPNWMFRLRAQLTGLGHQVIASVTDGQQAILMARMRRPDIALLSTRMPTVDGLEASKVIDGEDLCPVILLTEPDDVRRSLKVRSPCVQAYLTKPVDERELEQAVELAVRHFRLLMRVRHKIAQRRDIIGVKSMLKTAIQYLAAARHLSPHQAQEWVHQEARAKKACLYEVAEAVLDGSTVRYHHDVPM
jgi:AmiR/NasT family two-component response regulator